MKVAIYARYSTALQDKTSIDGQVANCEALAACELSPGIRMKASVATMIIAPDTGSYWLIPRPRSLMALSLTKPAA